MMAWYEAVSMVAGSLAASSGLAYWRTHSQRRRFPCFSLGTTVRFKTVSGVFRSKIQGQSRDVLTLSAPLSRSQYVPFQVDERLTVEVPVQGGVCRFRSRVIAIDSDQHEIEVESPVEFSVQDRREAPRTNIEAPIMVEGAPGWLLNVSAFGAKLQTQEPFAKGERLELDFGSEAAHAWVMETSTGTPESRTLRVRFEEAVNIPRILGSLRA